uniref:Putative secreted protein n=1 Tax=Ixodes ricinus TaxID=34613 RepID=A0A6B0UBH1_IXORI
MANGAGGELFWLLASACITVCRKVAGGCDSVAKLRLHGFVVLALLCFGAPPQIPQSSRPLFVAAWRMMALPRSRSRRLLHGVSKDTTRVYL